MPIPALGAYTRGLEANWEISKVWLPLTINDLGRVDCIANVIHSGLPERTEVFSEKIRLFPRGCFKYIYTDRIVGYGISHPWKLFSIPELDAFLGNCPDNPDCLYIHDVAILQEARGHHAAADYVSIIKHIAQELLVPTLACVSVYGTDVLWKRFGFIVTESDAISQKLTTYGTSAKYMIAYLS
jgi:hypothetical protein